MKLHVDCYSGHKEGERPVRFRMGEHEYIVEEVVDQWYGPEHTFFKVKANDSNVYILRRETSAPEGSWELVFFRHNAWKPRSTEELGKTISSGP